uniref:uncharacterized protein LOC120347918 n=1 Tax=Styela clava TaxID=7725 RepID=UPI001939779F|nr:uncharacterized protein LOC120347918 [Styela clava]
MGNGKRIRVYRRQINWPKSVIKVSKSLKKCANIFRKKQKKKTQKESSRATISSSVIITILNWFRTHCITFCACLHRKQGDGAGSSWEIWDQEASVSGIQCKNGTDGEIDSLQYQLPRSFSDDDFFREPTPPHPFAKILEQRQSLDYIERMDIQYAMIRSMDPDQSESPDFMLAFQQSSED